MAGQTVVAVKQLAPDIVRFRLPELGEKDFRGILARCRRAAAQGSITCRGKDFSVSNIQPRTKRPEAAEQFRIIFGRFFSSR